MFCILAYAHLTLNLSSGIGQNQAWALLIATTAARSLQCHRGKWPRQHPQQHDRSLEQLSLLRAWWCGGDKGWEGLWKGRLFAIGWWCNVRQICSWKWAGNLHQEVFYCHHFQLNEVVGVVMATMWWWAGLWGKSLHHIFVANAALSTAITSG